MDTDCDQNVRIDASILWRWKDLEDSYWEDRQRKDRKTLKLKNVECSDYFLRDYLSSHVVNLNVFIHINNILSDVIVV